MDLSSFLTSLGTSFLIFFILMLLFAWLSKKPGNAVVYYPNRILKGLDPWEGGSKTRNPFAWIKEALTSTEQEVIALSGVDTAVYFVFLSTVLGILVLSSLILLPVLLPVSATDIGDAITNTTTSNGTFSDLDKLSIGHVQAKSPRLWAYLLGVYWVSFVSYFLLWKAYKHVSDLRSNALMTPDIKPEQFAVVVRDIPAVPEGPNRKEQVDSYFRAIYPETYYKSMIVTNNKEVNKLWKELEGFRKKLERAEAVYAASKTTGSPEGTRPTNKTGFLGLCGAKVDSIEYYTKKINETIPKLEAEQKVTLREKQLNAALVFFTNRVTAASAAQTLHARMVDTWTVMAAPEPRQVLWPNLKIKFFQRQVRQYVVYIIVALTVVFYMIPIGFISAVTTLDNLVKFIPFIKPVVNQSALKTVLEAYLPQLALIIFLALLPKLLLALSKAEGIPSQSHAIRAAAGKYFYFIVFNVFLGVTVGGALFSTFKEIEDDPNKLVPLLATSLPGSATYFITFVALKFFVGYGLELSRIVPLIIFHLKRKYLCKTEGELKAAWQPSDLGYGTRVPGDMLIITVALCYSVIAPLILPFGVLYFGIGWLVLRNQALKVYCPAYESNGKFWPHMQLRILAALILYQVTMVGFLGVKKFVYAPLLIPLPILSLIFGYICSKKFYRFFQDTALEVASHELKEIPNMEQIYKAYLPQSLCSGKVLLDDDQFEDAKSNVSRTASFA
ncbi:PREDICTED: CSC1-like protein ERD4 [Fragaria vesca subsp. vesca]|uniref:CSC1-like protein ERD4 n=1 Tax=Fragaria vesca subsp. vesca TaxID=101020 RepID=UPI0002C31596|nr:PREDICTED: CSC1-like protein ERD4 [Fragaria vesca subsp. vesca]